MASHLFGFDRWVLKELRADPEWEIMIVRESGGELPHSERWRRFAGEKVRPRSEVWKLPQRSTRGAPG